MKKSIEAEVNEWRNEKFMQDRARGTDCEDLKKMMKIKLALFIWRLYLCFCIEPKIKRSVT